MPSADMIRSYIDADNDTQGDSVNHNYRIGAFCGIDGAAFSRVACLPGRQVDDIGVATMLNARP